MTGVSPVYAGIDVGASRTKVALIDADKNIIGYAVKKSGTDFSVTSEFCIKESLKMAGKNRDDIVNAVSTGYGRKNVSIAGDTKTEIACHGRGSYFSFPMEQTIVDIGGQDNKIIKLDRDGRRTGFKMNRKCAAGTGAFLEEMSARLDIPLEDMNELASRSKNMIKLGSFCTVFSGTEVLENIRKGKKVEDIVKGLFFSVITRITEMDYFTEHVVFTGGVAEHNPFLVEMAKEIIKRDIMVPEHPQLAGAIGAALYAMDGGITPSVTT